MPICRPAELYREMYETLQTTDMTVCFRRRAPPKGRIEDPVVFCEKMLLKVIRKISKVNIMDGARELSRDSTPNSRWRAAELQPVFPKTILHGADSTPSVENRVIVKRACRVIVGLLVYAIDGILAFSAAPLASAAICWDWRISR